jgi:hypothetical protein
LKLSAAFGRELVTSTGENDDDVKQLLHRVVDGDVLLRDPEVQRR